MTRNNFLKSSPIFLAFLVKGFGDVSGPLTSQLQTDFSLSNFEAGLVTFMAFIMFGLMAGFAVPGLCMVYILYIASRTSKA